MGQKEVKQPEQSYKLSAYTVVAMVNVLVAAVTTMFAMVTYAKPFYYYLQAVYGKLSEYELEFTDVLALSDGDYTKINTIFLMSAIPIAISAVLAIVNVVTATNAEKKPLLVLGIIAFILSAAAIAIFLYGTFFIEELLVDNPYVKGMEISHRFGIFGAYFIAAIVNALLAFINIFSVIAGRNKWKKTGRAY